MDQIVKELSSLSQFRVRMSDFTEVKEVSTLGAHGTVYSGFYPLRKKKVAIKAIPDECPLEGYAKYHIREVKILASLDDFFLLHFVGFSLEKPLIIVTELMEKGDLFTHLFNQNPELTPERLSIIAIGVAKGMINFHSLGYYHRDLKSPNILLDDNFLPRICDFGCAREYEENTQKTQGIGTLSWMSPESLLNLNYDSTPDVYLKADVYSFGILLWEMLTKEMPFLEYENNYQIKKAVVAGKRPDIPRNTPENLANLIQRCWDPVPQQRPTFEKIIRLIFKKKICFPYADWDQVNAVAEQFFWKTIIWRDPKVNNEENTKLLNTAKSKFKKVKIFGVDNNIAAFDLIESAMNKQSVWIISNRQDDGRNFLIECKKKGIKTPMLVYCGTDDGWADLDDVKITTLPEEFLEFIQKCIGYEEENSLI